MAYFIWGGGGGHCLHHKLLVKLIWRLWTQETLFYSSSSGKIQILTPSKINLVFDHHHVLVNPWNSRRVGSGWLRPDGARDLEKLSIDTVWLRWFENSNIFFPPFLMSSLSSRLKRISSSTSGFLWTKSASGEDSDMQYSNGQGRIVRNVTCTAHRRQSPACNRGHVTATDTYVSRQCTDQIPRPHKTKIICPTKSILWFPLGLKIDWMIDPWGCAQCSVGIADVCMVSQRHVRPHATEVEPFFNL